MTNSFVLGHFLRLMNTNLKHAGEVVMVKKLLQKYGWKIYVSLLLYKTSPLFPSFKQALTRTDNEFYELLVSMTVCDTLYYNDEYQL